MSKRTNSGSKYRTNKSKRQSTYEWTSFISLKCDSNFQSCIYSMGSNMAGQLGLGESISEEYKPCHITKIDSSVVQVACGGMHTTAILSDSSVVTFGCNDDGALGRLVEDIDEEGIPSKVETDFKAVQIAAGDNFTAALSDCGIIYLCGTFRNKDGNFGLFPEGQLKEPEFRRLQLAFPVKKISAGYNHLGILSTDGMIYTLGTPESGQLGRIASCFSSRFDDKKDIFLTPRPVNCRITSKVIDIWCGGRNTFFLLEDKNGKLDIYGCGINNFGQLGIDTFNDEYSPVIIRNLSSTIKQIAVGDHHTLLLFNNGDLYSMGRNVYGQLGVDQNLVTGITCDPVKVECGIKFVQCACGPVSSFALGDDGIVYSWGASSSILGQGENDNTMCVSKPTPMLFQVPSGFKVTEISAAGIHACLLCERIYTTINN